MTDQPAPPRPNFWLARPSPVLLADPLVASAVFVGVVSVFFLLFPRFDLWFSGLFYATGMGFPMAKLPAFITIRSIGDWTLGLAIAVVVVALVARIARPDRPSFVPPRASLFILTTLILGPGLIVNLLLKNNWGRPRPYSVDIFGGDAPFVGVWQFSTYCARNCSFVSGEASSALWLFTIAMVAPPHLRRSALWLAGILAVILSFNRIAFGGHFLSDVLLSWGITAIVILAVHRAIYGGFFPNLTDQRLDHALGRVGLRLRGLWERFRNRPA